MKYLALLILLMGCIPDYAIVIDQELRRELFCECLAKIPKGPESTKYNDWSEVVKACNTYAMDASKKVILRTNSLGWLEKQ